MMLEPSTSIYGDGTKGERLPKWEARSFRLARCRCRSVQSGSSPLRNYRANTTNKVPRGRRALQSTIVCAFVFEYTVLRCFPVTPLKDQKLIRTAVLQG